MAGGLDFRDRERLVLFSGIAAATIVAVSLLAAIAGSPLGTTGGRLATTLVMLYLCARLWGHAKTLEERGVDELLSKISSIGAPCIFLVLLAQTWVTSSINVRMTIAGGMLPQLHVAPRIFSWSVRPLARSESETTFGRPGN